MVNQQKASEQGKDFERAYAIQIDENANIAVLTFQGEVTLKELVDSFRCLLEQETFQFNMSACYDFSQAVVTMDLNETEIFFHFAAGRREKRGDSYQLAFVYGDTMTKMLVDFYRLFLARTSIEVYAATSLQSAVEWIKNESTSQVIPLS